MDDEQKLNELYRDIQAMEFGAMVEVLEKEIVKVVENSTKCGKN